MNSTTNFSRIYNLILLFLFKEIKNKNELYKILNKYLCFKYVNLSLENVYTKSFNFGSEYNNLRYLNCSNISILEIPKNLINLKILKIINTKINSSIIPKTLINLERIYADGSNITKLSKKLYNLKKIIINNTNIRKIKYYKDLEYLDCSNNILTSISQYSNLKTLKCNNTLILNFNELIKNNISSTINNLHSFNDLLYLDCSNTNIINLPMSLNNLIYLNISNTLIKYIEYRSLLNLEILIGVNSKLEILNKTLIKLKVLNINNNSKIKKIPSEYKNLEYLSIDNTKNIKKLSKKTNKIIYLSCENSQLKYIPINYFYLYFINIINTNIIYTNRLNNTLFYFY